MISHEYKCIFIHIPKCAGTSIESALGHLNGHVGRGGQDHRSIRIIEQPCLTLQTISSKDNIIELIRRIKIQHLSKAHNPKNKYIVTKKQYESYFKFTIVRNPWARAFSWYKNVMRDDIHRNNLKIPPDTTFNHFLKKHIGKGMLRPQTYWLKSFNGDINFDYIGKFENLPDSLNDIKRLLNLSHIDFPHKIKGSDEDYRAKYSNESIELINKYYCEEIDLFGYKFE